MSYKYEEDFDATLVQYFSGQLVGPARSAFEGWLHEDPSRIAQMERVRIVWKASAEVPAGPNVEAALVRVKEHIRTSSARVRPTLRLEPLFQEARRSRFRAILHVAAVMMVLIGGGLIWRWASSWNSGAQSPGSRWSYVTARGERAVVNLPDGSVVTLNAESRLEVSRGFGASSRDVRLDGEGYFDVFHDPSRPFRVHGGSATARVLGTKFGVRSRPSDAIVLVAVLEGRVAVEYGVEGDGPVLGAGQVAQLQHGENVVVERRDVRRLLSWTNGRLVFDATPMPEVLAELGRWFDREFVLGDSALVDLKLTTALSGHSLAEAIAVLEVALGVRAVEDRRRIILVPFEN